MINELSKHSHCILYSFFLTYPTWTKWMKGKKNLLWTPTHKCRHTSIYDMYHSRATSTKQVIIVINEKKKLQWALLWIKILYNKHHHSQPYQSKLFSHTNKHFLIKILFKKKRWKFYFPIINSSSMKSILYIYIEKVFFSYYKNHIYYIQ